MEKKKEKKYRAARASGKPRPRLWRSHARGRAGTPPSRAPSAPAPARALSKTAWQRRDPSAKTLRQRRNPRAKSQG
eukprot:2969499-Rhodomonas_salina.1